MPSFADLLGDGLPVTIREVAPPFRVLILANRDRPERGVRVSSRQRTVRTLYPGTVRASTQVMGTEEDDIELMGWFEDPLTIIDGGPATRVALARGLQQGQNLCHLEWGTTILRLGLVKQAEFEFHRMNRIRYHLVFEVVAAEEPIALVPLPALASTVLDVRAGLDAALAAMDIAKTTATQVDDMRQTR